MDIITPAKTRFIEYLKAFNQLDPAQMPLFFYLPSMLITSTVIASPMTTEEQVQEVFTPFMQSLKENGFSRSEVLSLTQKALSDNIVIFSGSAIRYKKNGEIETELENLGFTYSLRKDDQDGIWKIIAGIIHDPDKALAL